MATTSNIFDHSDICAASLSYTKNFFDNIVKGKKIEQLNIDNFQNLSHSISKEAKNELFHFYKNVFFTAIIALPIITLAIGFFLSPYFLTTLSSALLFSFVELTIGLAVFSKIREKIDDFIFHHFIFHKHNSEVFHRIFNFIKSNPPIFQSTSPLERNDLLERNKTIELFTIIATNGKMALLWRVSELKKRGQEIEHIHPLKMLGYVFSAPNMQDYFDKIYKDSFKWGNFYHEFARRMNFEASKNNLLCHFASFAKEVNLAPANLKPFFDRKDWEGLLKYLIYTRR
jgi:hypothetical protein